MEETKQSPKYDPSKHYKWEPSSNFLFSGQEFGLLLNTLRTIMHGNLAQGILMANEANKAIDSALSRAVELGIAVEAPPKK